MSRLGVLVLVAAAATLATVLVRTLAGEALGSDAYSHLVWARDAVRHGVTTHAPFDYTVPKPFEQGVAALGTKLGAATFVFEWTSLAGVFACAAAAARAHAKAPASDVHSNTNVGAPSSVPSAATPCSNGFGTV